MFKLLKIILIIAVLAVGWWLLSPLFIDKEVNEELDPKVSGVLDMILEKTGDGLQKAGEAIAGTETKDIQDAIAKLKAEAEAEGNLDAQITDKTMMESYMEETAKMGEGESVAEDMPNTDEPTLVVSGSFVTVAHEGTGDARVFLIGDNHVVRLENLDVLNGPDLRVVLSKNTDIEKSGHLGDYLELGVLKGNKGNQNYAVPTGTDISQYHSVVIYCKAFKVVFNSANLVQ